MLNSIGKWKVFPIESGDFRLDGGAMMGSVPKVLWEKTNPSDDLNRIDLALRCLLLDDGKNRVLIETGMGDKLRPDFSDMFHVVQPRHPLKSKLSYFNYKLEDITHVILTHLHFDHSGGATTYNNRGDIVPTFPKAKYYISERNWEAASKSNLRDRASYLGENYLTLKQNGCLNFVSDNSEVIDGISTISVNGHTKGQQLIKISSNNETLVFCSDLIPLKSHLKLPWIMGYDLNAELTLEEKTLLLQEASREGWWLWFYHDPNTVAVKIEDSKKYYNICEEVKRCDYKKNE